MRVKYKWIGILAMIALWIPLTVHHVPVDRYVDDEADVTHVVQKGETLSGICQKHDIGVSYALALVRADPKPQYPLKHLQPGQVLRFWLDDDGVHQMIMGAKSHQWRFYHSDGRPVIYSVEKTMLQVKKHMESQAFVIKRSLFADGLKAGVPASVLSQLSDVFGWQVDLTRGLKRGDRFKILYETDVAHDMAHVLYAAHCQKTRCHEALEFLSGTEFAYFTANGQPSSPMMLRYPLKTYRRISSYFNLRRFHPVLHKRRPHRGVDFAAPLGTPILATADGKVLFKGRRTGYGNTVELQHGTHYQTRYAHMAWFAPHMYRGKIVKRGDVIGFVGHTGLATGNHVHYEVHINGKVVNPLTAKLPRAKRLTQVNLSLFKEELEKKRHVIAYMLKGHA